MFSTGDVATGARTVIVNQSFVDTFVRGQSAVGRRIRYPDRSAQAELEGAVEAEWYTIVGVARDVSMTIDPDLPHNAAVYHTLARTPRYPLRIAVHIGDDASGWADRLREIGASVDPTVRLAEILPMDRTAEATLLAYSSWLRVVVVAGGLAILLTLAGIYALLSFTVSRRTHEIGVRVALGADRLEVLREVLGWTARRVVLGVAIGLVLFLLFISAASGEVVVPGAKIVGWLGVHALAMTGTCLLACLAPTLRALRIDPREALSSDG